MRRPMKKPEQNVYDVLISGAGVAGASLALDAAQRGLSVALIDARAGLVGTGDTRTTAFMPESVGYLERLGLWTEVADQAQPLMTMRLLDDRDGRRGQPEELDFAQGTDAPLAHNLPNRALAQAQEAALTHAGVSLHFGQSVTNAEIIDDLAYVTLADGTSLLGRVCFAADSRRSAIREALGIGWRGFSEHQTALTARLTHGEPHEAISTEFHRHDGPMTLVPVAGDGHQSALVWCLSNETAQQLAALDDAAFCARVQLATQGLIGQIEGLSARAQFPVRPGVASHFSNGPFALMAEAAHVLPPLLAQGLNLSLKDAEIAGNFLSDHGPTPEAVRAYANQRWPDVAARLGVSEGLNQLLTRAPSGVREMYGVGQIALKRFGGLRNLAVKVGLRFNSA